MKYIIEERTALAIRDYLRSYLELDEYGATLPNLSYPVHSLYLDSPDLKLYQAAINGDKNRYKLRLRFYEKRPDAPVFCEIKRRMNNTISKQRSLVRPAAVERILAGHLPDSDDLASNNPAHYNALLNFYNLMNALRAQPRTHVAYLREAWMSPHDNSVRVTMDRDIRTETDTTLNLYTELINPVLVFRDLVVLELKFTGRFPDWFREMVQVFGLTQCGAAKYADGVTRLGAHVVSNAFSMDSRDPAALQRLERIDRRAVNGLEHNGRSDDLDVKMRKGFA